MISPELQQRVTAEIQRCLKIANEQHKVNSIAGRNQNGYIFPHVEYKRIGRVAGRAYYHQWKIVLNPDFFVNEAENMINDTVPHEIAHLVTGVKNSCRKLYERRYKPHGQEWQDVMTSFGCKPKRCHNYDTTHARRRVHQKFKFQCGCGVHLVGLKIYRKITQENRTYTCKKCKAKLIAA